MSRKYWESPYTPSPHSFSYCWHLALVWCICYNQWTYTNTSLPPKVCSLPKGSLLVLYILRVFTNVWWHVSTITVRRGSLHCPEHPWCSFNLSPSPKPWGSTWSFCHLHSSAFFGMLYNWNHILCSHFRWASFT